MAVRISRRQRQAEQYAETPEGQQLVTCSRCDGHGELEVTGLPQHGGPDVRYEPCPKCHGAEQIMRWELM